MKRLYFIRHGECEANLADQTVGQQESPLTQRGKSQAKKVGESIKSSDIEFDLILTSPLSRAKDTAKIIADITNFPINLIIVDPALIERGLGKLEAPGTDRSFFKDDNKYPEIDNIEGAESIKELQKRADRFYEKIKQLPEKSVLIVGHGMFGRALRRAVNSQPYTEEYAQKHSSIHIPYAEIIKLI